MTDPLPLPPLVLTPSDAHFRPCRKAATLLAILRPVMDWLRTSIRSGAVDRDVRELARRRRADLV